MNDVDDTRCCECGLAADGPGDSERVNCDCGSVVCSACCHSVDGESYCTDCMCELRAAARLAVPSGGE